MALGFPTALRNTRAGTLKSALDAGGAAGKILILNGTRPATGGAVTTTLAEIGCSYPCGTNSGGVLTFAAFTTDASANAAGTATWFRALDSTGAIAFDGSITATGGGGDMTLATTTILEGVPVAITSGTITEGNL